MSFYEHFGLTARTCSLSKPELVLHPSPNLENVDIRIDTE